MNRFISILLISLLTLSVYAYEPEYSYSVISTRHYGAQSDADNGYERQNNYNSSYGIHTSTQSDSYHSSYGSDYRSDRISANTFSSTPSMEITTMLPTIDENNNGYGGPRRSSGVRPPQREEGEGDSKPGEGDNQEGDNWNDPNSTPLGDTPWFFMLLLVAGYALRVARKHKLLSCLANRETR